MQELACSDCEPGFQTHIRPGRVGHNTAVRTFILLGHPQNLQHPIRKGYEAAKDGTKARTAGDSHMS